MVIKLCHCCTALHHQYSAAIMAVAMVTVIVTLFPRCVDGGQMKRLLAQLPANNSFSECKALTAVLVIHIGVLLLFAI